MTISSILSAALFLAFFILFINGGAGWLLVYTIVAAVAVSFAVWFLSRKAYTVSMDDFTGVAEVGRECIITLRISRDGFCLLPHIVINGEASGRRFEAHASLMFSKEAVVEVRLRPDSCGLMDVSLGRAVAYDFFGLFRSVRSVELCTSVAVLPRHVEYNGPEVVPSLLPSESEEREEGVTAYFGGTAGYDHRDYVPGDALRRVNYKLSAKKRRLLVRLDETGGNESTNILLTSDADGDCAEQALALADMLVLNGNPTTLYYKGERFDAASPPSLDKLREWLAFRRFDGSAEMDKMPTGNVCVVISPQGITLK